MLMIFSCLSGLGLFLRSLEEHVILDDLVIEFAKDRLVVIDQTHEVAGDAG